MQNIISKIDHTTVLFPRASPPWATATPASTWCGCAKPCKAMRDAPFFISARQAGEVLGVHFTDASKMLSALVADGGLTLVSKGAGKVASRYRCTPGVFEAGLEIVPDPPRAGFFLTHR